MSIVTIVGIGISIGFSFTALATSSLNRPSHEGSCTTRVSSYSTAMETMIEAMITIVGITIVSAVGSISISLCLRLSEGQGDQDEGNQKLVHFEVDHYPLWFSAAQCYFISVTSFS